ILPKRWQADVVRRLDQGKVAPESFDDLKTVRVYIQAGDRVLGSVNVGFSLIDINEELGRGILFNILLGIIFITLFSGISILVSGRLTRPLEKLNKAMAAVNEGDLTQKVVPETHDEIAQLTESFNDMMEGLHERQVIEHLGNELGSTFQFDRLVMLIRNQLSKAIGASDARLYLRERASEVEKFDFADVAEKERYPPIVLSGSAREFLLRNRDGFMIQSAPEDVLRTLNHTPGDEEGLVMPMFVKDELFGLLFFALPPEDRQLTGKQQHFASILANQAALALENVLLYEDLRDQERLKRELEIAREVQKKLLPSRMPHVRGFNFDGYCQPAQEVGGDYFDFFHLDDNHLGMVIADVSGKGTSASFYMAEIKGMMLQLTERFRSPSALLSELNRKLWGNIDRSLFVTMIYGVLEISTRQFTFARAGHNSLLKIGNNGHHQFLTPRGIGIGLDNGNLFEKCLEEVTITLAPEESLVFYTDGLTEAMNGSHHEFGEVRLVESIVKIPNRAHARHIRNAVLQNVSRFMENIPPHDDITLMVLNVEV
ncbi:MAG: HAMP domain-containing protein, partial [Calditrichaeota bacterium]